MRTTTVMPSVAAICMLTVGAMAVFGQSEGGPKPDVRHGPGIVTDSPALAAGVAVQNDLQEEWCLTQIKWDEKQGQTAVGPCENGNCDDPAVRNANIPNAGTPIKNIQIRFHVFRFNDGSGEAATPAEMVSQLATLNAEFAPYKIAFTGSTVFHNDSQYRNLSDPEVVPMKNEYADSPSTQMNVYILNYQPGGSYGTFPWDSDALGNQGGIILDDGHVGATSSVLTHEVGHTIGLWHTHHGVSEVIPCSACYEQANGANANTTGDLCGDTAPTPINFACSNPGGTDPCSSTPWGSTDIQNYMSYGGNICWTEFSPHQSGRFHCWTNAILSSWLVGGGGPGSCAGACGGQSPDGCFCDDDCAGFGDCCDDVCQECPGTEGCAGTGTDCCENNGTPGCNVAGCEAAVCSLDSFCCTDTWDNFCANRANDICTVCGGNSDCCEDNGTPGCGVPSCQDCVCNGPDGDEFCCDVDWDGLCQDIAEDECQTSCPCDTEVLAGSPCGPGAGSCTEDNGTPGCDDIECCEIVCAEDPFCCDNEWDSQCVDAAAELCTPCGDPAAGDCLIANGSPGCDDAACCEKICATDPFCCEVQWDGFCAGAALDSGICNPGGCPGSGSCCEPNGTIGCSDALCCEIVCLDDPFCCDNQWDTQCANGALELCGDTCHDCCTPGGPGCSDSAVEACVCAEDPFCCETGWDTLCIEEVVTFGCGSCGPACGDGVCDPSEDCESCPEDCGPCCGNGVCGPGEDCENCPADCDCPVCPGDGDCCEANGSVGCDDTDCCECICTCDPFCCGTTWDSFCAGNGNDGVCGASNPNSGCATECAPCLVPVCGDGVCDPSEDCESCPEDCGPCCGNGVCGPGEDCENCPADCGPCCGNGVCGPGEDCENCPADCGPCDVCPGEGDCCQEGGNGSVGCDDTDCCECICACDPFCCENTWDGFCAGQGEFGVCGASNPMGPCVVPCSECLGGECPPAEPISIDPPPGTEDARQPHNPGAGQDQDPALRQGIGSLAEPIVMVLSASGASADCFSLCETSPDSELGANGIASVTEGPLGTYTIVLNHAIAPGAWTTISYAGGSVAYLSHPANSNADGFSNASDVLALIDVLNGVIVPPFGMYSVDIDHSGAFNASDVLRLIDLLNGAIPYDVWNGVAKPDNTCP